MFHRPFIHAIHAGADHSAVLVCSVPNTIAKELDGYLLPVKFLASKVSLCMNSRGCSKEESEASRLPGKIMNWREHITSDPQVLRGKPCIKGTRIPAALVLGFLAAGRDTAAILHEFPDLSASNISACLDYARDLADFDAVAA